MRILRLHRIKEDAKVSATHTSLRHDLLVDKRCFVGGKSETYSVVISCRGRNLRVHSNDFAAHVDERAARVAAIDSSICLQKSLKTCEVARLSLLLRDNSGGHGLV